MSSRRLGALLAAAALLLGACTGSGDGSSGPLRVRATVSGSGEPGGPTGTVAGPTPYLPVPDGVVLTDQGSELGVGETAIVAWRPAKGEVAVLSLRVRQLRRAPIKELADWQLDAAGRQSSLFYVTVTAENLGETDLGGTRIPLYVADDKSALVESNAFKTEFKPCPSPALPADVRDRRQDDRLPGLPGARARPADVGDVPAGREVQPDHLGRQGRAAGEAEEAENQG